MSTWRLIESGPGSAAFNMALDEALSVAVRKGDSPPVLRLYGWSAPSVSIGAFQKTACLNMTYCSNAHITVVRRITGGRAILHGDEITYSLASRHEGSFAGNLLEVYRKVGTAFNLCFEKIGLSSHINNRSARGQLPLRNPLCFESASVGEISHNGIKLIGSAQKRWKDGFMQQGTIPFSVDRNILAEIFSLQPEKTDRISHLCLIDFLPDLNFTELRDCLVSAFEETFGVRLVSSLPSAEEFQLADHLASRRYLDPAWTQGERADSRRDNKK